MPETKPDETQALIETVREALGIGLAKTYPTYRGAIAALSKLEATLGQKTVPLAMVDELIEYGLNSEEIGETARMIDGSKIVSKHMPDFTVK